MKQESKFINKVIKKYGLKVVSYRKMYLLPSSYYPIAYAKGIRKYFGFSTKAAGLIGGNNYFYMLLNEKHWAGEMAKYLANRNNFKDLLGFLTRVNREIKQVTDSLSVFKFQNLKPESALKKILRIYEYCSVRIGVYNSFWRYSMFLKKDSALSAEQLGKIATDRHHNTAIYLILDRLIKKYCIRLGSKIGIKGELLMQATGREMTDYLAGKMELNKDVLLVRSKGYLYIYTEKNNKEYVFSGKVVELMKKRLLEKKVSINNTIKGQPIYKGIKRGKALVLKSTDSKYKMPKGCILVTSTTRPGMINQLKNIKAIVSDEGGLLSHAAIVSRELKIPGIVGTKIATKVLKDGDLVEVDATKGIVKKI